MSSAKHRDLWEAVDAMQPLEVLPWRVDDRKRTVRNAVLRRFKETQKIFRTLVENEMLYVVRIR